MNIINSVLKTALLTSMMFCIPEAKANEEDFHHRRLITSLQNVGITISINDPICQESDANGLYHSQLKLLVVCQDNAKWNSEEVLWTSNDYDTLRHEAHHVLQDCVGGELGDGELSDFFDDENEYNDFIVNTIGSETAGEIAEIYEEYGASPSTVLNEVEAFAVANSVSAEAISIGVTRLCANK